MARKPKISKKPSSVTVKTPKSLPATKTKTNLVPAESSGDFQEVRSLIELMKKNGLAVFKFEQGDFKITLKTPAGASGGATVIHGAPPSGPTAPSTDASDTSLAPVEQVKNNYKEIKSPMVGTFYVSSAPEADPFVNVGQTINAESIVCIIEAMKVMNEIKAEMSGTVVEIVAENGKPVQFGEVLLRVK
jgi:acetyl-CoA carboxylase biotin carboxyl carrier protein